MVYNMNHTHNDVLTKVEKRKYCNFVNSCKKVTVFFY